MTLLPLLFLATTTFATTNLVEQHSRALALGKLDTFVRFYKRDVRRGVDLLPLFENLALKERRQVRAVLAQAGDMPALRRDGEALIFSFGADELRVEFPDLRQNQFIVGGVAMAFDPSASPAWQMRLFKAKLDRAGRTESAAWGWMFPEAHAFITPAGKAAANYGVKVVEKKMLGSLVDKSKISVIATVSAMFGAGFAGTIKTTGVDILCNTVTVRLAIENTTTNWVCGDWKAKNVQIAAGTATKQIGYTKELETTLNWDEEKNFVCPPIATEGKSQLTANMQATEGRNEPVWFKWVGNLEKGEHKTADVYRVDDPDKNPKFVYAGTITFLPSEGIVKDPVRVDIPPDPTDLKSPDSTRSSTPYKSFDAMPVPEMPTYKEAVAARRLISLSNTMKVVAQNCRQARKKVEAPAGLRQGLSPADR